MASLIFAQAKSIRRKALKRVEQAENLRELGVSSVDPALVYQQSIDSARHEFREIIKIAALLHEDYKELTNQSSTNLYWITIRPKPNITFTTFYQAVVRWCQRDIVENYYLAFEQKSTEGDGTGFHIHMLMTPKRTVRSKGECLRYLKSTFNDICDNPGINLTQTKDLDMFKNYCIEYKSLDGHKDLTKLGDSIWRNNLGLKNYYTKNNPLPENAPMSCLPSPGTAHNSNNTVFELTF